MAVWSKISSSDLTIPGRIDSEYFRPKYLAINKKLNEYLPLKQYLKAIIHPGEFKRIYSEEGINVIRAQNVRPMSIEIENNEIFVSPNNVSKLTQNVVQFGDILITRTGANFGQTALYTGERKNAIVTSHTFIVRSNDKINSAFLALFLNTTYGRELINQGTYGSSQPEIAPKYLKNIPIPRFTSEFEARISSDVFKAYDLRKESKSLYSQATKLLKRELGLDNSDLIRYSNKYISTFNELTSGNRIDSEYFNPRVKEIVKRISNLEHTRIGVHFRIKNGYPWDSKRFLEDNSGEPVIRIRDIKQGYIENEKLTSLVADYAASVSFQKSQPGDVVIGMDGIKYFLSSIVEEPCLVNQRVCHISPKESGQISSEYASFIINSEVGQAQLLRDMTIATTVGHITNANVAKLIIPIVSKEFHDEITNLVRGSIEAQKESKRLLEQAKTEVETLIEQASKAS